MSAFEREPVRTDVVSLSAWRAQRERTPEQLEALRFREEREREAFELAHRHYERSQKSWPVRLVLGFLDLFREVLGR